MTEISRRDFLNGFALTIAAGLTPAAQVAAQPLRYPPALTGMRGHHPGSFEVGHALRDGATFAFDQAPIEESYDLVVVGGGISGLAAAWFYRRAVGADARILILDNHDDFGGHAKRNEFRLDGRLILGYGGSESMQSPQALYSKIAKLVLTELGVDIARFESAFERDLYPSLNLSRGVFFPREAFGRDTLVTGDPTVMVSDDIAPDRRNGKPVREFIAQFPVSAKSKGAIDRAL
jgi:spermidine dehydrogenase